MSTKPIKFHIKSKILASLKTNDEKDHNKRNVSANISKFSDTFKNNSKSNISPISTSLNSPNIEFTKEKDFILCKEASTEKSSKKNKDLKKYSSIDDDDDIFIIDNPYIAKPKLNLVPRAVKNKANDSKLPSKNKSETLLSNDITNSNLNVEEKLIRIVDLTVDVNKEKYCPFVNFEIVSTITEESNDPHKCIESISTSSLNIKNEVPLNIDFNKYDSKLSKIDSNKELKNNNKYNITNESKDLKSIDLEKPVKNIFCKNDFQNTKDIKDDNKCTNDDRISKLIKSMQKSDQTKSSNRHHISRKVSSSDHHSTKKILSERKISKKKKVPTATLR